MRNGKLLFLFVLLTSLISCNNRRDDAARYIPKDAALVIHLNGKSLSEKLPWEEILQNKIAKHILADSSVPDFFKKVINHPQESGVDIQSDIYSYLLNDSKGSMYIILGPLKDASKFTAYLSSFKENKVAASGNLQTMVNNFAATVWDDSRFLMLLETPDFKNQQSDNLEIDSLNFKKFLKVSDRDLLGEASKLFKLNEKESMKRDRRFGKMIRNEGDIHLWVNNYELMNKFYNLSSISVPFNVDKFYKDNFYTVTIRFENGQIKGESIYYTSRELTRVIQKNFSKPINKDIVNKLDGKNLAALYFFNMKPEGIKEIINIQGLTGLVNMGAMIAGFSIDDVVKAFKGDFVFAVNDLKKGEKGIPDGNYLFAGTILEKDAFNKVFSGIDKLLGLSVGSESSQKIYHEVLGNYFAIGNRTTSVKRYLATKSSPIPEWEKLKGYPIGGFLNLQYLLNTYQPADSNKSLQTIYNLNIGMWDNFYVYGGRSKNGGTLNSFELNLMDKNTNSLKQLNQLFNNSFEWLKKEDFLKKKLNETKEKTEVDTTETFKQIPTPYSP